MAYATPADVVACGGLSSNRACLVAYDLFVSYSRRDNAQGRITDLIARIGRDFESVAGRPLRPFFDVSEIHGMDDWRHRILRGLRESRLLLAVLSPAYVQSEYCEWEFHEYVKNEVVRALVGEGVAPIDLVDVPGWRERDFDTSSAEWVAELRRRQAFDMRPWFHEGQQALRHAEVAASLEQLNRRIADHIQRGERREQSPGNVDAHNAHFVGRRTDLRRLRETVALGKVGVLTAVHGLGGMGKTALAIEYAHAFSHEYGGGRWQVRCEGREDLATVITTLAPVLGLEPTDAEKSDAELRFQRVLSELHRLASAREPHRCLLILDNVDRPALLEPAQTHRLPGADWLHVIATTRLGENDLFGRHRDRAFLPVDDMPEGDALDLIGSYQPGRGFSDDAERDAAREVVRLLGGFTLAVESAAVFLGQFAGDVTCRDFLERLKSEGLAGLDTAAVQTTEGVWHGEKRLMATLQPTLERLTEPEIVALAFAALFPADDVALPWIRALEAAVFPDVGTDAQPGYPDPWKDLLRRLFSLRLLQPTSVVGSGGQPLVARMHRLLQEMVRIDVGEDIGTFQDHLNKHITSRAEFLWDGWVQRECRWEIASLASYAGLAMKRGDQHATRLASLAFGPLQHLGDFAQAEALARLALEIDEQRFGPQSSQVGRDLNNLAALLHATNRMTEAETIYRRVLAIDEQNLGAHQAITLNNLAQVLKSTNQLAEAEILMRRALEADERRLGPSDRGVARDLNNLATLLKATGRLDEAEPLMRRALAIDEGGLGPDHPDVAQRLNNLATLLEHLDRIAEAEPLYRRALEIDERALGPYHHDIARDLNNLAMLLKATNRLDEAEPLMRRSLEIDERVLGPLHWEVGTRLNNLGLLLQASERSVEAELLLRRALAIDEESLGPDHPHVARDLNSLASVLRRTNRTTEAESSIRRALEIQEQSPGSSQPDLAACLSELAQLLQATKRLAEAEPLMRRALAIDEQSLGPYHSNVARDLNNLAVLLHATNRLPEAESTMRRVIEILMRFGFAAGREHPHFQTAAHMYNQIVQEMGYSEAEVIARLNTCMEKVRASRM
jgi:tetratricopeptide (TPR) repeat protein